MIPTLTFNLLEGNMRKSFQKMPIRRFQKRFHFRKQFLTFSSIKNQCCLKGLEFAHEHERKENTMKKLSFMVAILLSLVMINAIAGAQGISQVLLIPREAEGYSDLDAMLIREVGVMTDLLQRAGFKVMVATTPGQPIEGFVKRLKPDLKLSEVNVDDYTGIILACMACGFFPGPPVSPAAVSVVRQAVVKGKPIAANSGAIYTLAEAGVLVGKRYSFPQDAFNPYPPHKKDLRFEGAIYSGHGVIQEGIIITSGICARQEDLTGLRDGTPELTRAFIAKLGRKK
jgi:protease I